MRYRLSPGRAAKSALRLLPIGTRKILVRWLGRQRWLSGRYWYSLELLRDLAEQDPDGFHRFLWSNHLAYAETYEVGLRFGPDKINRTRMMLFDDLLRCLASLGLNPDEDIRSVFDVGCSMGYVLRYVETDIFPAAEILEGIDIDQQAIESGTAHLRSIGSRVRIQRADMSELERVLDGRSFDIVLCAGVLMYLQPEGARQVLASMLRHCDGLLVLSGLAHPTRDNREMRQSEQRARDSTWIHDLDRMIAKSGGEVVFRRWEGERVVDGNTVYFLIARPSLPPTGAEREV